MTGRFRGWAAISVSLAVLLALGFGVAKMRPRGADGVDVPTPPSGVSQAAVASRTPTRAAGQEGRVAKNGDHVSVHYTGTLDDGTQFDSSIGREPLAFTLGAGQVIPGFDHAVIGLKVGQSVTVHLEPKDAYGERSDALILAVPIDQAPAGLKVGDRVNAGGRSAVVTAVTATSVTIDVNPELAGKALNFKIELVSIGS